MPGTPASQGRPSIVAAIIIVYGLVVFAGSFLEHDFACHQNSRTHCPFCQIIQAGQKIEVARGGVDTPDGIVGRVELSVAFAATNLARSFISDRAPPA